MCLGFCFGHDLFLVQKGKKRRRRRRRRRRRVKRYPTQIQRGEDDKEEEEKMLSRVRGTARSATRGGFLNPKALFSSRQHESMKRKFLMPFSSTGDISNSSPLIATAVGSKTTSLADCFQKLSQVNAEIKESRQVRLGGKEVKMFLTVGTTEEDLRKTLNSMEFSFVEVDKARDTAQDIKGPYCETSPLLPYVRRIQLRAPYTKAIEMKITDLMCRQGVTLSHLDQYRSGKDIIMEGIAHMPTGVAEFPKLDEVVFVQSLEKQGILVKQFSKIVGNPAPIGK